MYFNYKGQSIFAFSDTHGMHRGLRIPSDIDILICAGDVISDYIFRSIPVHFPVAYKA